jgi:hypothetical protein
VFDRVALLICDRATFHEQNRWVDEPKQLCFFCGRETRCHIPTRAGDNPPQPGERYVQRSVLQIAVENIPKVSWKKYPFPREWDAVGEPHSIDTHKPCCWCEPQSNSVVGRCCHRRGKYA